MYICICMLMQDKDLLKLHNFCLSNQIYRTKVNLKCFNVLSSRVFSLFFVLFLPFNTRVTTKSVIAPDLLYIRAATRRRFSVPAFAAGAIKQIVQFLLCCHLHGRAMARPTPEGVERFEVFAAEFALVLLLRARRLSLLGHLQVQIVQIADVLCGGEPAHTHPHPHPHTCMHIERRHLHVTTVRQCDSDLAKKEDIGNRAVALHSKSIQFISIGVLLLLLFMLVIVWCWLGVGLVFFWRLASTEKTVYMQFASVLCCDQLLFLFLFSLLFCNLILQSFYKFAFALDF